jgi:hypothetical protein
MAEATGILSKNTTLGYMPTPGGTSYTIIGDIQEIPEMGGKPDKVDVTTLADSSKRYISGLNDPGDLAFVFLYDNSTATSNFRVLKGLEVAGSIVPFEVAYPDGTKHDFNAQVSVSMAAAKSGEALTFTATLMLNSAITVVNPTTES